MENPEDNDPKNVPLMIVYDGQLCMSIRVDGNTEMPLAYVSKGTIINAHNFLTYN